MGEVSVYQTAGCPHSFHFFVWRWCERGAYCLRFLLFCKPEKISIVHMEQPVSVGKWSRGREGELKLESSSVGGCIILRGGLHGARQFSV